MATNNALTAGIVALLVIGAAGMVLMNLSGDYNDGIIKVKFLGENEDRGVFDFEITGFDGQGFFGGDFVPDVDGKAVLSPGEYKFSFTDGEGKHFYKLIVKENGKWEVKKRPAMMPI